MDASTASPTRGTGPAGASVLLGNVRLSVTLAACLDARMPSSGSHAGMFIPYANLSNSGVL
jgi:hypothetical protein